MSKICKGSIVWDPVNRRITKVLTSPKKGELSDTLAIKTGKKYHEYAKKHGIVLLKWDEGIITHNNTPCYMMRVDYLLTQKEYLEIQKELIIKSN